MQQSTTSFNTTSDFECFQNYTPAEVFVQQLSGLVNQSEIKDIIKLQKLMLQRFEKTNEMLINVNALSQNRLKNIQEDNKKNCKLLLDMKKDLEYVFRKIKLIKGKLETKYPVAFEQAKRQVPIQIEEDEEQAGGIDYEQLENKNIDTGLEAFSETRDSSDSTS